MSGQTFSSNHHKQGNSHQKPPYFVFQITTFFCHIPGSPFLQKGSCGGSAALQILPLITIVLDHKVIHTFPQMYIQHLVQLKLVVPYPWIVVFCLNMSHFSIFFVCYISLCHIAEQTFCTLYWCACL